MKVLSVQQPWASLICAGIKDVENRTWKPAQVPGRILIHASSKKVTKNFFNRIPEEMESYIRNDVFLGNLPTLETLPTSAIIGFVTVTGFEEGNMDTVWADGPGVIKWKLEDAWLFDEPILNVNGKLNLFDYDGIDEDNLPPAHQVEIADVEPDDAEEEVIVPCNKETFEQLKNDELCDLNIYLTPYLQPILCEEGTLKLKPYKKVTFYGEDEYVEYELKKETGVYAIPDPNDETKPYIIQYHAGFEGGWMEIVFVLGQQLDKGEYVNLCGGHKIVDPYINKKVQETSNENILKLNVPVKVFGEIISGKKTYSCGIEFGEEDKFCELDEDGNVKKIDGDMVARKYEAIQFICKKITHTRKVKGAIVESIDNGDGEYVPTEITYRLGEEFHS